jgi:hypothetical protein
MADRTRRAARIARSTKGNELAEPAFRGPSRPRRQFTGMPGRRQTGSGRQGLGGASSADEPGPPHSLSEVYLNHSRINPNKSVNLKYHYFKYKSRASLSQNLINLSCLYNVQTMTVYPLAKPSRMESIERVNFYLRPILWSYLASLGG